MYHYLGGNPDLRDTIRTSLSATPYWFEKQLQYLHGHGYQTIAFNDLFHAHNFKPVILTFDDGYRDFYLNAYPLLKKYQAKATIFIVPGFLDKPGYLFSWQLQELAKDPLITLGAHTMHHAYLPSLKPQDAVKEIQDSKNILEKNFGRPVTVFAYPYGAFNDQLVKIVSAAGFKMAVSTIFGANETIENPFTLPRIRVGNYSDETFLKRLEAK